MNTGILLIEVRLYKGDEDKIVFSLQSNICIFILVNIQYKKTIKDN